VENALRWLSEHNPCYKDVVISSARLDALPNDGNLMEQLPARDYEGNVTDGEDAEDLEAPEEEAVINFPARCGDPISDAYPDFFTKAYPVLFPNGDADFNARGTGRLVKVTLREWAAHLLRLADKRFDNHPRFRFTVYNRFIRQRALQVTQVFVKQQGLSSDYTIAQLLQAVRSNDLTIEAGHEVEDAVEFFDHYISAWNDCKLRSDEVRRALEGDDT
ncbi:hypothetical protein FOZ63_007540, partial [Perkinsus olseni]